MKEEPQIVITGRSISLRQRSPLLVVNRLRHRAVAYVIANTFEVGVWAVALVLHLLAVLYFPSFPDEHDNILGGLLIQRGLLPNIGFFSHHMPLTYYVAALIELFTGSHFAALRTVLLLLMYAALLGIYRIFKYSISQRAGLVFVSLVSVGLPVYWGHMLLAENIISYSATALLLLYIYRYTLPGHRWTTRHMLIAAVLAAAPVLSSLAYLAFSAWCTLFVFATATHQARSWKLGLRYAALLATPYVLILLPYLFTGELRRFVFEVYLFNIEYYAKFQINGQSNGTSAFFEMLAQIASDVQFAAYGFTNPTTFFQFLSLMAIIAFAAVIYVQRGALLTVFAIGAILLAAPRSGITLHWSGSFHGQPYCLLTIAAFAIAIASLGTVPQASSPLFVVLRVAMLLYVLMVPITLLNFVIADYRTLSAPPPPSVIVTVIDALVDANETAWIVPLDFTNQAAIQALPPTRYTFWAPWHAICQPCTSEILQELAASQPKVIYWYHGFKVWNKNVDEYGRPVLDFIDSRYVRLNVPATDPLANFYFLASDQQALLDRLRERGFLAGEIEVLAPGQALHNQPVGDILPASPLRQEIAIDHDGLTELDVLMATYGRKNYGPVTFRLHPLDGPQAGIDLAGTTVDAQTLQDDTYFRIASPQPLGRGRYELLIEAPTATSKNCVTAWMQTGDPYPQGRLTLGNTTLNGDMTFRLVYRNT